MALFVVFVVVLAAIAVGALMAPLVRRGASTRPHLGLAALLAIAVSVGALGLYFVVGTPAALDPASRVAAAPGMVDVDAAIARLKAHLEEEPGDIEGWALLGRTWQALDRPTDARRAFEHALALAPDDPSLLTAVAESRSTSREDHRIDDDTLVLLEKALRIDPSHQRALWLYGIANYQRGDFAGAASTWKKLLALLDADSSVARSVREQIRMAEEKSSPQAAPARSG